MEPALRLISEDVPSAKIGPTVPLRPKKDERARGAPNKQLTKPADWVRHYIRDDELERSQLQHKVPTRKKPASKPAHR
jgi:hypothetical protein